jgi:uncharacterized membrane protein YfcA
MVEFVIALIVGILVGLIGSGGAIVAVPAFVYLANYSPTRASETSLVLVAVSAIIAIIGYARKKQILYKDSLTFALSGIVGAFLGTQVNRSINETLLLFIFAGVLFLAATSMLLSQKLSQSTHDDEIDTHAPTTLIRVLAIGTLFGFVTGLLGVGGGFLIVPLLTILLHYRFSYAVGTSVTIILLNTLSALAFRASDIDLEASVVFPLIGFAIAGALIGLYLHEKLPAQTVKKFFIGLLFVLGTYTLVDTVISII